MLISFKLDAYEAAMVRAKSSAPKRPRRDVISGDGHSRNRAMYAHCNCSQLDGLQAGREQCRPLASEPRNDLAQCICVYDALRRAAWLCRPLKGWSTRACRRCELTAFHGRCPTGLRPSQARKMLFLCICKRK